LSKSFYYSARTSHTIVQQKELNKLEVGPVFDTTVSNAEILALLFLAMSFGAGLPVMMPMAFVAFAGYFWINKVLLCRYNQRPPHVSEYAIQLAINTLPYAALLRLGVACWMFSNTTVFPINSSDSSSTTYKSFLIMLEKSWLDYMPSLSLIIKRMCRQNVFPLFAMFVGIIVYRIVFYLWQNFKLSWFVQVFDYYCRLNTIRIKSYRKEDMLHPYLLHQLQQKLRSETAPFSSEFYKFVKNKNEIPNSCWKIFTDSDVVELSEDDSLNGWILIEKDGYVMKVLPRAGENNVVGHEVHEIVKGASHLTTSDIAGEGFMYTYEFIADHGTNSYSLNRIPAYQSAIAALTESAMSILDHHAKDAQIASIDMNRVLKNRPSVSKLPTGNPNTAVSPSNWKKDIDDEVAKLKEVLKPRPSVPLSNASSGVVVPIATQV
jgi:hypothetical protein